MIEYPNGHQPAADLRLYTYDEVGKLLQIDKSYVGKLVRSGRLRSVRIGQRCVRIHPEDLRSFIESQR